MVHALTALGGLGLFLLGMVVMTQGLRAVAGEALGRILARFTRSPLSGAVTGAAATAVIQSSSATTVAAVGFVGAGILTFAQALGILFGANIGTTVTGWIVALVGFKLDLGTAALPLVLAGVLVHLFARGRAAHAGLALAGFALIFVALGTIESGLASLEGVLSPADFPGGGPGSGLGGRLMLVGLGILITLVTQSSSAGVAAALAAVHAGTITFPQAAAMVIGMDVGTTFTALVATIGGSTAVRRTGLAHVVYNAMTGAGALALLPLYTAALDAFAPGATGSEPELALVGFHTAFNTLGVAVVLPFAGPFARLIERLVPERAPPHTEGLDERLLAEPGLGLEAATGAARSLGPACLRFLGDVLEGRREHDEEHEIARDAEPLRAALERTHAYVARIPTVEEARRPRLAALVHELDHMRRLLARLLRGLPAPDVRVEPELAAVARELAELARRAAEPWPPTAERVAVLRELWRRLDAGEEPAREEIVRRAASGGLDPAAALGRLDELRRLRRLADHAWRIAHHAEASAPGAGAQD